MKYRFRIPLWAKSPTSLVVHIQKVSEMFHNESLLDFVFVVE